MKSTRASPFKLWLVLWLLSNFSLPMRTRERFNKFDLYTDLCMVRSLLFFLNEFANFVIYFNKNGTKSLDFCNLWTNLFNTILVNWLKWNRAKKWYSVFVPLTILIRLHFVCVCVVVVESHNKFSSTWQYKWCAYHNWRWQLQYTAHRRWRRRFDLISLDSYEKYIRLFVLFFKCFFFFLD